MKGRTGGLTAKMNNQNQNRRQQENDQLVRKADQNKISLAEIFMANSQQLGGLEDGKVTKMYFHKFLFMEQVCFAFNLMGLGISVIQYDLEYDEISDNDPMKDISLWLLWLVFVSSCLLVFLTVYRYQAHIEWMKSRKSMAPGDQIWHTDDWLPMLIELAVYCIIPLPFTKGIRVNFYNSIQGSEAYYHVNEILALIMICRVIYLYRTLLTLTFWYNNRTQRVCNLYACESNYMFVAKSLLRTMPYTALFIALISLICIFGYAVRICERPLSRNDSSSNNLGLFENALWNIIITITTVGYGDFYTRTDLGRFVIFIVCVLGIFVVSVMVVTLIESLKVTSLEGHAITVLERVALREKLKHEAALVIILTAKAALGYKNGTLTRKQHHQLIVRLKQTLINFKMTHRQHKTKQDENSLNEEITNQFSLLKNDFKQLMERQQVLISTNNLIYQKLGFENNKSVVNI
ncbi:unnamed protein product [Paramecium octaurelia]|uniref:Potassium channel domain-containing protein n=1 Tax=Paramecium octaurelia TaxID=43137 RepID=A0A8S1U448_PAROT|nr:unnamed protein product [Paramecium octaurelia]